MNDQQRAAMQMALEAFKSGRVDDGQKAITALREALAKPFVQHRAYGHEEYMTMDRACFERGCPCVDTRFDTEYVKVKVEEIVDDK